MQVFTLQDSYVLGNTDILFKVEILSNGKLYKISIVYYGHFCIGYRMSKMRLLVEENLSCLLKDQHSNKIFNNKESALDYAENLLKGLISLHE